MERRVAQTLNCFADEDFNLFADTNRPALMDLLHDYFCGDAPDTGMQHCCYYVLMSNNEYYSTDDEEDDNELDELSLSVEPCSGNLTDFSPAGTDDELEDQPLIEDYSTSPLEMNTSLLTGIGTPSSNMETSSVPSQTDSLPNEIPDSGEVDAFLAAGCGCSRVGGQPCSALQQGAL